MLKILSLDPSGTGKTGMFLLSLEKDGLGRYWPISAYSFQHESDKPYCFLEFKNKDWKKHLDYISEIVREWEPTIILYENTNYINSKGKDMTSLFRLMGAIESLPLKKASILVHQVKDLKAKLLAGTKKIEGLTYSPGRGKGWFYQSQRISLHQLDAFLVYWLWKEKNG